MAQVTGVVLPNNGDRIKTENYNDPITKILAQVNGGLDSANITPGSLAWESMASFTNKISAAAMQDSANLEKFRDEANIGFTVSGLVWSALTGLNGTMTSGVQYSPTTGSRIAVLSIASRVFTASKDTYVSISPTGSIVYQEVVNNASAPAITNNDHRWLAVVVTSGAAITSVTDLRQLAPIAAQNFSYASGTKIKRINTLQQVASVATQADMPNYNITMETFAGQTIEVSFLLPQVYTSVDGVRHDFSIMEDNITVIQTQFERLWNSTNGGSTLVIKAITKPSAGVHTWKLRVYTTNATVSVYANSTPGNNYAEGIITAKVVG